MKHNKFIATLLLLASTMPILQSCLNDDDNNNYSMQYPSAIVTVKNETGKLVLQLDDSTKLYPSNITQPPYGDKEDREWEFKQWEADGTTRAEEEKLKEERIRRR